MSTVSSTVHVERVSFNPGLDHPEAGVVDGERIMESIAIRSI